MKNMPKITKKLLGLSLICAGMPFLNISSAEAENFDYRKAYISKDNISEKNVEKLVKSMTIHDVIKRVGPPVEKIEKSVKREDYWIYDSFFVTFKQGRLSNLKIKPDSDLFNKVVLDSSFGVVNPTVSEVKNNSKNNPDIEGLLKDFGLQGTAKRS